MWGLFGVVRRGAARRGAVWCDVVWCGTVLCGVVLCLGDGGSGCGDAGREGVGLRWGWCCGEFREAGFVWFWLLCRTLNRPPMN